MLNSVFSNISNIYTGGIAYLDSSSFTMINCTIYNLTGDNTTGGVIYSANDDDASFYIG